MNSFNATLLPSLASRQSHAQNPRPMTVAAHATITDHLSRLFWYLANVCFIIIKNNIMLNVL